MSHDRGCHCGKEPYEYGDCRDRECDRGPVYDEEYRRKMVCERIGRQYIAGTDPWKCPKLRKNRNPAVAAPEIRISLPLDTVPAMQTFTPTIPPVIVRQTDYSANVLRVGQEGSGRAETLPRGEAEIAGPCRVRVRRGKLELVVNHDVPIRWIPAVRKGRKTPSTKGPAK